jgi:hypothetical protein
MIKIAEVLYYAVSCVGLIMSLTAFRTFIGLSIQRSSKELPSNPFCGKATLSSSHSVFHDGRYQHFSGRDRKIACLSCFQTYPPAG